VPQIAVRYFAAARAAAGVREETVTGDCIDDVLAALRARHSDRFTAVLGASSLLVDGMQMTDTRAPLSCDVELDVLPPFAGG
jgi:molybdopterin synthase sulfur carrier subunit